MTAMRRLAALLPILALPAAFPATLPAQASPSQIGAWSTAFYVPPSPGTAPGAKPPAAPAQTQALPAEAACIGAILEAEREAGIADHMLLAMGFTEAGRRTPERLFTVWPWTVNTEGTSHYFPTRDDAIAFVRDTQARGVRSIDVGCLQVNLKWHPDAFPDLATAFDPRANARYAARFLGALRQAHGSLDEAIARYHSAQSERGAAYRQRVSGNLRWVAHATEYLDTLAAGPKAVEAAARGDAGRGAVAVWGKAELGRLSFLSSLYTNARERPLLPAGGGE